MHLGEYILPASSRKNPDAFANVYIMARTVLTLIGIICVNCR